jgi:hypothetical protein
MVTLILSWPPLWDLLPQQQLAVVKDQAPPPFQVRISTICLPKLLKEKKGTLDIGFYRFTLLSGDFSLLEKAS